MASVTNPFAMLDEDAPAPVAAPKTKAPKEVKAASAAPKKDSRPASRGTGAGARGRGRGKGKGRGDRKREFDRTSGDRRAKKDGAGKYNWGKEGEDDKPRRRNNDRKAEAAPEAAEEAAAVEASADAEAGAEKVERAPREPEVEEEVEPPTMTYEQYHASIEVPEEDLALKVREVDLDESNFKSTTDVPVAVADTELGYEIGAGKKQPKKKGNKNKKNLISLDEFAAKAPAGRNNDRGNSRGDSRGKGKGKGRGKGDSRGGRGRPAGRGNRGGNFNLAAAKNDFPTLGA